MALSSAPVFSKTSQRVGLVRFQLEKEKLKKESWRLRVVFVFRVTCFPKSLFLLHKALKCNYKGKMRDLLCENLQKKNVSFLFRPKKTSLKTFWNRKRGTSFSMKSPPEGLKTSPPPVRGGRPAASSSSETKQREFFRLRKEKNILPSDRQQLLTHWSRAQCRRDSDRRSSVRLSVHCHRCKY